MKETSLQALYHCVYALQYHLVLVTKYRRKCLTSAMLAAFERLAAERCMRWGGKLIESNGEADHVHEVVDDGREPADDGEDGERDELADGGAAEVARHREIVDTELGPELAEQPEDGGRAVAKREVVRDDRVREVRRNEHDLVDGGHPARGAADVVGAEQRVRGLLAEGKEGRHRDSVHSAVWMCISRTCEL